MRKITKDNLLTGEARVEAVQKHPHLDLDEDSKRQVLDDNHPMPELNIDLLRPDHPAVYRLISSGDTLGVFQVESTGFQELCRKLKPDCFEDIVAAVALYRPGPMQSGMVDDFIDRKHGRKKVEYPHPSLEEVLAPTYGTFVYQEQIMQSAQVLAGYTLGGADLLRRAMGKEWKKCNANASFSSKALRKAALMRDRPVKLRLRSKNSQVMVLIKVIRQLMR